MVNFSVVVWQAGERDGAVPSCMWNPIPRKRAHTSKGPCSYAELLGSIAHSSRGRAGSPPRCHHCLCSPGCVLPHTQPQRILSSLLPKQHVEFLLRMSHSRCAVAKTWGSAQRSKLHPEVNLHRVPTGLTLQLPCVGVVPLLICRVMSPCTRWRNGPSYCALQLCNVRQYVGVAPMTMAHVRVHESPWFPSTSVSRPRSSEFYLLCHSDFLSCRIV